MPASLVALLVLLRSLIRSRVDLQLGKLGSAPSYRRASTLAEETPENNRNGLSPPKNHERLQIQRVTIVTRWTRSSRRVLARHKIHASRLDQFSSSWLCTRSSCSINNWFQKDWSGRVDLNHRPPGPEPTWTKRNPLNCRSRTEFSRTTDLRRHPHKVLKICRYQRSRRRLM